MAFRISGLPRAEFAPLFSLSDAALAERGVRRYVADGRSPFPCRISLELAKPGETVLLLNYEHQKADTPFRSRYAIYVRPSAEHTCECMDELPPLLRKATLSLRCFDASGMLLDADLAEGDAVEPRITRFFENPDAAYLHAHFARPGCYIARIDRA